MIYLLFGFLIGMRHALEADHLAAVATLAARSNSFADTIRQGTVWGIGHTITLLLFGSLVIWSDSVMPEQVARWLEYAVGVMLVILGLDVIRRVIRERVHFHRHGHKDGQSHFHAHSHAGEKAHDAAAHQHSHDARFPLRALAIGLVHGMAGSAALIILTLETISSPLQGMLYMLFFGVGSMLGMALLSAAIAIPLRHSARGLTWLHNGLQLVIGAATIMIGLSTLT
jgi:ABC-type nickel/cobalt efflux system permease component RcnA